MKCLKKIKNFPYINYSYSFIRSAFSIPRLRNNDPLNLLLIVPHEKYMLFTMHKKNNLYKKQKVFLLIISVTKETFKNIQQHIKQLRKFLFIISFLSLDRAHLNFTFCFSTNFVNINFPARTTTNT